MRHKAGRITVAGMIKEVIVLVTARSLLAYCSGRASLYNNLMKTPHRTSAAAFSRYAAGEVVADSASLQWKELFVRRYRFPNVVDRFLVPATPEPLMCMFSGLISRWTTFCECVY